MSLMGFLTDMMGIEECCFGDGGWGIHVCVCECVCWEVGMEGGGGGLPLCLPPLEIQKAVCLALRLRHRGQI